MKGRTPHAAATDPGSHRSSRWAKPLNREGRKGGAKIAKGPPWRQPGHSRKSGARVGPAVTGFEFAAKDASLVWIGSCGAVCPTQQVSRANRKNDVLSI